LTTTIKTTGKGRLVFNSFNSFTYTPKDVGKTDFVIEVSDSLSVATATITFNVEQIPEGTDKPVIVCDQCVFELNEDASLTLNFVMSAPAGSSLQVLSAPQNGITSISGQSAIYRPFKDYNGSDTFFIAARSAVGVFSDPLKVQLIVKSVIDEPMAKNFSINGDEDNDLVGRLVTIDPDKQWARFEVIEVLTNSIATVDTANAAKGVFVVSPKPDANGQVQIKYLAVGQSGLKSEPAVATVKINAVNDKPTVGSLTIATKEDAAIESDFVLVKDVDNTSHTYSVKTPPANGRVVQIVGKAFKYLPNPDYFGEDSFTYVASDGLDESVPAKVSITVTPVNDVPVIVLSTLTLTTNEDTPIEHKPVVTHPDPEPYTLKVSKSPSNGTVAVSGDKVVYKPKENFNGSDTFSLKASDGTADSNDQTVMVNIKPVNDAPTFVEQIVRVDGPTTGKITATDVDGDKMVFGVDLAPKVGVLKVDPATGSFSFLPSGDNMPEDFAVVSISDGLATTYGRLKFNESAALNNPPRIMPLSLNLDEGASKTFQIRGWDLEDGQLSYYQIYNDSLSLITNLSSSTGIGTITAPKLSAGSYKISVVTRDSNGVSGTGEIAVVVNDVNEAPPEVSQTYLTTSLMTSVAVNIPAKDGDGQLLTVKVTSQPKFGTFALKFAGSTFNTYTYTRTDTTNTGNDSVGVTLSDGSLETAGTFVFNYKRFNCASVQQSYKCNGYAQNSSSLVTYSQAKEFCENNASLSNRCCTIDQRMGGSVATIYSGSTSYYLKGGDCSWLMCFEAITCN
jgi:hypothetical protein